jgi:hypothetical protein
MHPWSADLDNGSELFQSGQASLHGPTIVFNHFAKPSEKFTCNSSPVIWLFRCGGACDRQDDVLLRFQLGGVNGLGIKVKRRGHLGVEQQALNCLYILAPANQKRRKGKAKGMESVFARAIREGLRSPFEEPCEASPMRGKLHLVPWAFCQRTTTV